MFLNNEIKQHQRVVKILLVLSLSLFSVYTVAFLLDLIEGFFLIVVWVVLFILSELCIIEFFLFGGKIDLRRQIAEQKLSSLKPVLQVLKILLLLVIAEGIIILIFHIYLVWAIISVGDLVLTTTISIHIKKLLEIS